MERTLCMLKPGVLQRRLLGQVLSRLESGGLRLVGMKMAHLTRPEVEELYQEHAGKVFWPALVDFTMSAPVILLALEGESAVKTLRNLMGATNPAEALPGTIRGDLGGSTRMNLLHGSDSREHAARELSLFFAPGDYFDWTDTEAYNG